MSHFTFYFFPMSPLPLFIRHFHHFLHFFIKGHVGFLQLLKWPCRTSCFTHVEPYVCQRGCKPNGMEYACDWQFLNMLIIYAGGGGQLQTSTARFRCFQQCNITSLKGRKNLLFFLPRLLCYMCDLAQIYIML